MGESGATDISKGETLELEIEDLAYGGKGVAKKNGFVIFVDGAIPDQRVRAVITRRKKAYAEARVLEVLRKSPWEVEPRCKHFGSCGGCRLQNLAYEKQLEVKRQQVVDALQRIGGLKGIPVESTLPSPDQYFYRNKMEFSFSDRPWREQGDEDVPDFALGLHRRGRFDKVLNLDECWLQAPETATVLKEVREFAFASGLPPYSNTSHEGFWRFLVLRRGVNTGQWMVNVVTTEERPDLLEPLTGQLQGILPGLRSFVNNVNTGRGGVAFGESEALVWGERTIEEKLGDYTFEISANSFFQTNTKQAERLYNTVLEFANFTGDEMVYDLYSGTGSIAIYLSGHVRRVLGVESVDDAVADAWRNAERNHITNCYFIAGDLREVFRDTKAFLKKNEDPDVIVLDPPRDGVHPKVLPKLASLGAERIVYVSCNPTTQARDLAMLAPRYRVVKVRPVDMFPQTSHIEAVALLVKK